MDLLHVHISRSRDAASTCPPLNWSQFFDFGMFCQKVPASEVGAPIALVPTPKPQKEILDSPLTKVE